MTWIVLGSALALCLALILAERLLLTPRAILTVEDVVTSPGRPVRLRAHVERDILPFWDPPVAGVDVLFGTAGAAKTDASGNAELVLPAADAPGRARHEVSIRGRLPADPAPLVVDILAPDAPVFVIDIDGTVARCSAYGQAVRENRKIRAIAGAADGVKALARRFAVVFLTARDHTFRAKTLEWLRDNGFPEAPVLLRRLRYFKQSAEAHKRARLSELAPDVRLAAGVGDLRADAAVYKERGMRAYVLGRAAAEGAVTVADWPALLAEVERAATASSSAPPPASSPSQT